MTNLYENHIDSLARHSARIATPDGSIVLTQDFYHKAVEACGRMGCEAATYELILPGIEDEMGICIRKDGRVDSGSMKTICDCLAAW